jgi:hypothetical protein
MSVTIHGIECRNCYDVDWARRAESEDKKKAEAEAARKAKEATAPPGSPPDIAKGVDQASSFDQQPATILAGAVKASADSGPVAPPPTDTPGQSVNIVV